MKTKVLGTALALSIAGFAAGCGSDEGWWRVRRAEQGSAEGGADPAERRSAGPDGRRRDPRLGVRGGRGQRQGRRRRPPRRDRQGDHGRAAGHGPRGAQGRHAGRRQVHQRRHHVAGARRAPAAASGPERHLAARARQGRRADRRRCSPNAFRAVHSTSMEISALSEVLAKLPAKRWAVQSVDYSTGHPRRRTSRRPPRPSASPSSCSSSPRWARPTGAPRSRSSRPPTPTGCSRWCRAPTGSRSSTRRAVQALRSVQDGVRLPDAFRAGAEGPRRQGPRLLRQRRATTSAPTTRRTRPSSTATRRSTAAPVRRPRRSLPGGADALRGGPEVQERRPRQGQDRPQRAQLRLLRRPVRSPRTISSCGPRTSARSWRRTAGWATRSWPRCRGRRATRRPIRPARPELSSAVCERRQRVTARVRTLSAKSLGVRRTRVSLHEPHGGAATPAA